MTHDNRRSVKPRMTAEGDKSMKSYEVTVRVTTNGDERFAEDCVTAALSNQPGRTYDVVVIKGSARTTRSRSELG